ncbi:MAG: APC family permease [Cytophagaceae bacterium]
MGEGKEKTKIGLVTAICIIVANMIGVGVYTSIHYQAMGIQSSFAILALWIVGGLIALSGALTYGELAVHMPRSGGEYNYLSRIYHPAIGFLSGWVSSTVGFSAPLAAMAMAFGFYFGHIVGIEPQVLAFGLVALLTLINISSFRLGSSFHTVFTIMNVLLILLISIAGYVWGDHSHYSFTMGKNDFDAIFQDNFAVSLVFVSFAYSGWNSATYVAGEIKDPARLLPKALFIGTLIVLLLYVLLNFIFLYTVPIPELAKNEHVAFVSAVNIFGHDGAKIISIVISIGLIASVNSIMIAGPRVTQVIGQDFPFFSTFARENKSGTPVYATVLQSLIAVILIATSSFQGIITYIGFTLSLFTTLTVTGVFVYRSKHPLEPGTYRTWGYPITPLVLIGLELWMMYYLCKNNTEESLYGFATILSGLIVYYLISNKNKTTETRENN